MVKDGVVKKSHNTRHSTDELLVLEEADGQDLP